MRIIKSEVKIIMGGIKISEEKKSSKLENSNKNYSK